MTLTKYLLWKDREIAFYLRNTNEENKVHTIVFR